ncbi:MAG: hypothetical protein CME61_09925 [Halobacteriovoraceae bacterium]|nr:hypothetical protein [Halobacteriovoraceae bacterium]
MKFYDTHFDEYLSSHKEVSLHPKLLNRYDLFPAALSDLKNLIFYGPKGVGKYTQMLAALERYSPTNLKYEKRISVTCGKSTYVFKISDVHFEIDMSLLGCNSKTLWNDIYNQVVDIVLARADNIGVIVCKYFHDIHSELLDTFYSYMQSITNSTVDIKFVLLTEQVSFIPDNILQRCQLIRVSRPSKALYNKVLKGKLRKDAKTSDITNIKNVIASVDPLMQPHKPTCDDLLSTIKDVSKLRFATLRDKLYEVFIYDLDITDCVWYIFSSLVTSTHLVGNDIDDVLVKTLQFLQYYNNNYRPIYHLESYILYLCKKIHGF